MKIDWVDVFAVGLMIVLLPLALLLAVFLFLALPWIIENWILTAGITLLIGLILIGIAFYMYIVRGR